MFLKGVCFASVNFKCFSIKACPIAQQLIKTCTTTTGENATATGGITRLGESFPPVKMAFTSYESTKPEAVTQDWPIIIMHGLLGSKANWNSMSKLLHSKTKRKVYAVDARNHGDSPHSADFTYFHLAEDLRYLMSELQIPKATLIGHSMGGRAVMLTAMRYPELVEKLVVVDISPLRSSPHLTTMPAYFEAMKAVKFDSSVSLSKARKMADEQLAKFVPDADTRSFLLTNLVEDDGSFKWRVNLESLSHNFPNIATFPLSGTKCEVPTLFVAGGLSDFLKTSFEELNPHRQLTKAVLREEDFPTIQKDFTAAKLEVVRGAGHWVHADKPHELMAHLCNFIQGA